MNKRQTVIFATISLFASPVANAEPSQPNIVIIFADDLGYGDVSCFGATKIATPNIDRLANQGMKFTDAHSAASLCSPSRYGLLTGRSPWRLHKKGNGYRLRDGDMTLAAFLKDSGYKSAAIGKWHLGYSKDWNKLPITGPLEVGFDYHFGVPQNHNDSTRAFIENHDLVGRKPGEEYRIVKGRDFPEGLAQPRIEDQVDSMLTEKAVEFIRRNAENRFFLYFTPCAPHTHVTPAAKFRGTSKAGLFGDHVQELDSHVGTILRTLNELSLTENTLVIFASDNGSTPKDFKGTQGVRLNLADETGDIRRKFKSAKEDAKKVGHVTNGPWRDGKGYAYEGGHRVPFIARWPGKIKPGAVSNEIMSHLAPEGPVYQAGTLSGNPLAMSAGLAMLTELNNRPEVFESLAEKTEHLHEGFINVMNKKGIPYQINRFGSMISLHFTEEPVVDFESSAKGNNDTFRKYFHGMLGKGIYLPPSAFESYFLNDALSYGDLDETISALEGLEF